MNGKFSSILDIEISHEGKLAWLADGHGTKNDRYDGSGGTHVCECSTKI
jgi:hypothetical protein